MVISVPEIRDYHAVNAEMVRRLDAGDRSIRLTGVRGHRLLAAGLTGGWEAVIEIDGDAGPEFAAGLDAPSLTVVCRGRTEDGAASRLRAGRLLVLGEVGVAFGYAQSGGLAVAGGDAGARAGLGQSGGDLVLLSSAGAMMGERQSGGRLFAFADRSPARAGRGRRGGQVIRLDPGGSWTAGASPPNEVIELVAELQSFREWLGSGPGSPGDLIQWSPPRAGGRGPSQ